MYSASAFAINTLVRSAVAAAFPLFTVQMFTTVRGYPCSTFDCKLTLSKQLGVNWACTTIGLIALLFVPSPFLFYKYGPRIRTLSKFAPCIVSLSSFGLTLGLISWFSGSTNCGRDEARRRGKDRRSISIRGSESFFFFCLDIARKSSTFVLFI